MVDSNARTSSSLPVLMYRAKASIYSLELRISLMVIGLSLSSLMVSMVSPAPFATASRISFRCASAVLRFSSSSLMARASCSRASRSASGDSTSLPIAALRSINSSALMSLKFIQSTSVSILIFFLRLSISWILALSLSSDSFALSSASDSPLA